jgi:hypothetical protein
MSRDDIRKALTIKLDGLELNDDALDALSGYIVDLQEGGFAPNDVFPVGIVRPDLIGFDARIALDDLNRLRRLLDDPKLTELKVYPKGIPMPDELLVSITRRR